MYFNAIFFLFALKNTSGILIYNHNEHHVSTNHDPYDSISPRQYHKTLSCSLCTHQHRFIIINFMKLSLIHQKQGSYEQRTVFVSTIIVTFAYVFVFFTRISVTILCFNIKLDGSFQQCSSQRIIMTNYFILLS